MAGPLAPALEYGIVAALLKKEIFPTDLDRKSLSHIGQFIHKAVEKFIEEKVEFNHESVLHMVVHGFGADQSRVAEYLVQVTRANIPAAESIYGVLRDRATLLAVANEISSQFASGNIDPARLSQFTSARSKQVDLTTIAEDLEKGEPVPPEGPKLVSLPSLSGATNGLYGVYLVAGMPNVGKSTLGAQILTDVAFKNGVNVLLYDYENGRNAILYRLVRNFGINLARKIGQRIYVRESLRTLNRDLAIIKPPAVIAVDSIQKIATKTDDRREGLDGWVHRFEELKQEGYHVLLVSEINRQSYTGDPKLDCFKETGALEYAADSAVVVQETDEKLLKTWLVKNRHYPFKGQLGFLERAKDRDFWFQEVDLGFVA